MKHYSFDGLEFDLPAIDVVPKNILEACAPIEDGLVLKILEGPLSGTMFVVGNFAMDDTDECLLHYDLSSNLKDDTNQKMLEEIVSNFVLSILIDQARAVS